MSSTGVTVVVSQSMYFPWVGMYQQLTCSDVFIHLDDVALSRGSFVNRVQVKGPEGRTWMTIPIQGFRLGQSIEDCRADDRVRWRSSHLGLLERAYRDCEFGPVMLDAVRPFFSQSRESISTIARESMLLLAKMLNVGQSCQYFNAKDLVPDGRGSERVLKLVEAVGGTTYVTGHGAARYLDHEAFEARGIEVRYMAYDGPAWQQRHGEFTPFVSALDLFSNLGSTAASMITTRTIYWRDFLDGAR